MSTKSKTNQTNDSESTSALYKRISTNLNNLKNAYGCSQKQFADITGVAEATASNYFGNGTRQVIPTLEYLFSLCANEKFQKRGIVFSINDLLSDNFCPSQNPAASERINMSNSFKGNYFAYLFDQSKPINEQEFKFSRELRYGVITIYSYSDQITGTQKNKVIAKFYKGFEKDLSVKYKTKMDEIFEKFNDDESEMLNKVINQETSNQPDLYVGELQFSRECVFINISSENHFDNALIVLYTTSKKADKDYLGGCGCVSSVTHGDDHMPAAQKIILSKYELKCSDERIGEHLSMASTSITPSSESMEIAKMCEKLYSNEFDMLAGSDKVALINNRITQLIKNYIEKNICCVSNVSKVEDKAVYNLIKEFAP